RASRRFSSPVRSASTRPSCSRSRTSASGRRRACRSRARKPQALRAHGWSRRSTRLTPMDFFDAQERARRRTTRLVVLFVLAVLALIAGGYFVAVFVLLQVEAPDAWLTPGGE